MTTGIRWLRRLDEQQAYLWNCSVTQYLTSWENVGGLYPKHKESEVQICTSLSPRLMEWPSSLQSRNSPWRIRINPIQLVLLRRWEYIMVDIGKEPVAQLSRSRGVQGLQISKGTREPWRAVTESAAFYRDVKELCGTYARSYIMNWRRDAWYRRGSHLYTNAWAGKIRRIGVSDESVESQPIILGFGEMKLVLKFESRRARHRVRIPLCTLTNIL